LAGVFEVAGLDEAGKETVATWLLPERLRLSRAPRRLGRAGLARGRAGVGESLALLAVEPGDASAPPPP
jgi:hypothetical protein